MKKGFTLAEVLITLAVIGVVAALTIPLLMVNARENGNITAFKKAVSVLNNAIDIGSATDMKSVESTTSEQDLINQLKEKMNIISSNSSDCSAGNADLDNANGVSADNACWFTAADGMQFILPDPTDIKDGSGTTAMNITTIDAEACDIGGTLYYDNPDTENYNSLSSYCGAHDGAYNAPNRKPDAKTYGCTVAEPCYFVVDVNGVGNPNRFTSDFTSSTVKGAVTDRFVILVTANGVQAATAFDKAAFAK